MDFEYGGRRRVLAAVVAALSVAAFAADPLPVHRPSQVANEPQPPTAAEMEHARAEYEMRRAVVHARLRPQAAASQVPAASPHAAAIRGRPAVAEAETAPSAPPSSSKRHLVPFLPHADTPGRESFVRVVNLEDHDGQVRLQATDDDGRTFAPVVLAIGARQSLQLGARDLQQGNQAKGLTLPLGPPEGDWRLVLTSSLALRVLAHAYSANGAPASIHQRLHKVDGERRTALFRPLGMPAAAVGCG